MPQSDLTVENPVRHPHDRTSLLTKSNRPTVSVEEHSKLPFQIAQAEKGGGLVGTDVPAGETHAAAGHNEEPPAGEIPNATLSFANSVLIAIVLIVFAIAARRSLQSIPRGFQNLAEWIAESLNNFTVGIIGPGGEKYTPLVGTIFLYILLMNLWGLIPGFHSPSSNLSITLALGVVVFVYVQYVGVKNRGVGGHIKHFMGPMPAMALLMFPVELISEIVKPFTLAVRLFGNIFGEDVILIVLAGLGGSLGGSALGWLPIQFPVFLLAVLTSLVQALVFAILTCIYITLVSHHEEGEHGEDGSHGATQAHATGH